MQGEYIWRCIKLTVLEQAYIPQAFDSSQRIEPRVENRAITVGPDANCVFSSTFQQQEVEFLCSNNCDRIFRGYIEFLGRKRDSQVRLVDPEPGVCFELGPGQKRSIRLEVESKIYGESVEQFVIKFEKFRIKRSISIVVCETEAEAEAIKQNLAMEMEADRNANVPVVGGRNAASRSRHYANQVILNFNVCKSNFIVLL